MSRDVVLLRKCLEMARQLVNAGIPFVPVPITDFPPEEREGLKELMLRGGEEKENSNG